MAGDPVRRIANRRRIIADLRLAAAEHEYEAVRLREAADRLESSTRALEDERDAT